VTKKMLIGATVFVTLMVLAFKNDPATGQAVLTNFFTWILP